MIDLFVYLFSVFILQMVCPDQLSVSMTLTHINLIYIIIIFIYCKIEMRHTVKSRFFF